jgi:hypothetical protein
VGEVFGKHRATVREAITKLKERIELAETFGKAVGFLECSNAIGEVTEIEVGDPLKVNVALKSIDPFQQLRLREFQIAV